MDVGDQEILHIVDIQTQLQLALLPVEFVKYNSY